MPEILLIPDQPAAAGRMKPCRSKRDARRCAIAQVAWDAFREQGFDAASMSLISERLGGSKATLYQYFRSKEDLFLAAVDAALETGRFVAPLDAGGDLRARLTKFARDYLSLSLRPEVLSLDRVLISQSAHLPACEEIYDRLVRRQWRPVADALQAAMDSGELRKADAWQASILLKALIESDTVSRHLHAAVRPADPVEIEATVAAVISTFFQLYGNLSPTRPPAGAGSSASDR